MSSAAELEAGSAYVSEIVGCDVWDGQRFLGRVSDVQFGAGEAPLLVVKLPVCGAGGLRDDESYWCRFAAEFVKKLDLTGKRIDMELPEGLLDLDAPLSGEEKQRQKTEADEARAAGEEKAEVGSRVVSGPGLRKSRARLAMKFEIITIFPDFFRGPLDYGIVRRARESGLIEIGIHDLRAFAHDRHRTVDDRPFGGGEGMVLKPEPIFECLESLGVAPRQDASASQGVNRLCCCRRKARCSPRRWRRR